jgi:VWFA-related protein
VRLCSHIVVAVSVIVLHAQERDYKLTTQANLVVLDVSVADASGGFVSGLTKDDFRIVENGKAQTIASFSHADEPVTAGLVIDNSGSMRPKREAVNRAALAFIDASNADDEIFVTHFNDRVHPSLPSGVPFTGDRAVLMRALLAGPAQGRTALYDAMVDSLRELEAGHQRRKCLLLISDGGDNASHRQAPDVVDTLRGSLATIYTIGIFDDDDEDRNPRVLKRLAEISGGQSFFPKELGQVDEICRRIAADIRNRYTIAYVPSAEASNTIRKIRVEIQTEKHRKLIVHARTSYRFPDSAGDRP